MSYREREKSRSRPGNGNKPPFAIRPVTVTPQGFQILDTTSNFSRSRPKKEKIELLDVSMLDKNSLNNNNNQSQQRQQQRPQIHTSIKRKTTLALSTGIRPKTSGEPTKAVHFSGIVDRFNPGSPTSHEGLNQEKDSSEPCKRKHQRNREDTGITAIKNRIDENNNNDNSTELYNFKQNSSHAQNKMNMNIVPLHKVSTCDLEFMNKEFKYDDDAMSVMEFQPEDVDGESYFYQVKSEEEEEEQQQQQQNSSRADGDSSTSGESRGLMSLMNSIISFPNLHRVNLAKVGELVKEQICAGITQIFSDNDVAHDEFITCNGYKIHTIGKNLCINSLILRGVKSQSFRIIVQTKDYQGMYKESNKISKIEPKILMTDNKWTLLYGSDEEEGSGLLEIEVPPPKISERINGINTEGPCHGLIFIDVPIIK